jgi:hypothetical protein
MFVQVIEGRVQDAAALRAAIDEWVQQLAPGASGWLGSTGGVTDDGRAIALVRFESEQSARENSARPEQDQWWAQTAKLFDGEPTFSESSDVTPDIVGDPGRAGFVQVMKGRGTDPERARELMAQDSSAVSRWASRAAPGPWRCTSPQKRKRARARRKSRQPTSRRRWTRWAPSRWVSPSSSTCGNPGCTPPPDRISKPDLAFAPASFRGAPRARPAAQGALPRGERGPRRSGGRRCRGGPAGT